MNARTLLDIGLICLWLLVVVGWFVALFLWAIPTMSIGLTQILSLSLGTIVALILYFVIWLPMMIYSVIIGILMLFN